MKILVLNIYFAPISFGGATIVAEENIKQLQQQFNDEILVVTTINDNTIVPYAIRRYRAKGVNIIGINITDEIKHQTTDDNPSVSVIMEQIINRFEPDVIHIHSIQSMGYGYFDYIVEQNIPLVVTLHDCWWICDRQFMIASDGRYCFQNKIDLMRCGYCTSEYKRIINREQRFRHQLNKASLLLFPSEFHRQLHIDNGYEQSRCRVNKNGIRLPEESYAKAPRSDSRVVFGFVGGPGEIKGAELIIKAFQALPAEGYELQIVDAAKNVGESWEDSQYWDIPGKVSFIPPYSQDTMDEFFSGIDVLLFPSQWKESFGLIVREALARNIWIIATDAGGVVEDLVDGENASVIPLDGNYVALQQAIEAALTRPEWPAYENPHRTKIRGYSEQASELHQYFMTLTQ